MWKLNSGLYSALIKVWNRVVPTRYCIEVCQCECHELWAGLSVTEEAMKFNAVEDIASLESFKCHPCCI